MLHLAINETEPKPRRGRQYEKPGADVELRVDQTPERKLSRAPVGLATSIMRALYDLEPTPPSVLAERMDMTKGLSANLRKGWYPKDRLSRRKASRTGALTA
jgi:hypothetical protein